MKTSSKCCHTEAQAINGDEGTAFYMCQECQKPCDLVGTSSDTPDDIKFDKGVLDFLAYIGQREQSARKDEREKIKNILLRFSAKIPKEVLSYILELIKNHDK